MDTLDPRVEEAAAVFYTAAYHYRRKSVLAVGLVLLVVCAPLFIQFLWELVYSTPSSGALAMGVICTAVLGLFAVIGVVLIRYFLTSRTLPLVINREGVRYGDRFFPWRDIGSLHARPGVMPVQLLLLRRGRMESICHLMTNDGMTASEFERLMRTLRTEVAPYYDHLKLQ